METNARRNIFQLADKRPALELVRSNGSDTPPPEGGESMASKQAKLAALLIFSGAIFYRSVHTGVPAIFLFFCAAYGATLAARKSPPGSADRRLAWRVSVAWALAATFCLMAWLVATA